MYAHGSRNGIWAGVLETEFGGGPLQPLNIACKKASVPFQVQSQLEERTEMK